MAISQTRYDMPGAFISDIDFSPLTKLGDQLKQHFQEAEAARLIKQLYERGDVQQPAQQLAAGGGAVAQRPPIERSMLPPVPGYNLAGNPAGAPPAAAAAAAPPAAPGAPGAPNQMPPFMQSGMAGNYNPAPPPPSVDPRSPVGRLMARLGKGPSPDSVPAPFPVAGTSPVPGQVPDNAVPVAPEPPWYNPQIAQALSQFGGGAPPAPGAPQPPFPAPLPGSPAAPAPATAEAVPVPRERPVQADLMPITPPARAPAAPIEAQPPVPYTQAGLDRALGVIRQKESSGDYGNVTTTRNRSGQPQSALGAYGVMDFNVGPWTKEVLGREMSPQEFLGNRAAQDAVARAKFAQYAGRYGLTGAAKAWFAGETGMNNPGARDALGTSVSAYASDFDRKAGLPSEITAGASRPAEAPTRMAFDATSAAPATAAPAAAPYERAVQNLASPQPASAADISSEEIAALYRNPLTRPIATAFLQKRLDPGQYDFQVAGDQLYRVNKRTGTAEPIPVHQKMMTVGEDARVFDPNTRTYIGGDSDSGKYGKLGANMRWVDVNDKSKGQEAIPGGAATQLPAEVAAKIGLGKSFLNNLPSIKQRLDADMLGVDVNPSGHLAATIGGVGASAEMKRQIDSGADALLRMLTGAGMGIQEAHNYAMRYTPTARDTKEQLLSKMAQLENELHATADIIGRGHGGSPLGNMKRVFGAGGETPAASGLASVLGVEPAAAPAAAPGTQQLEVGKAYYGRKYLGGPPGDPKSWSARTQ